MQTGPPGEGPPSSWTCAQLREGRKAYCSRRPRAGCSPPPPPPPPREAEKPPGDRIISCLVFCLVLFLVFPFLLYLLAQATQHPPGPRAESVLYPVHSERLVCAFDVRTQFWGERRVHLPPARLPGGPGRASEQRHAGWGWGGGQGLGRNAGSPSHPDAGMGTGAAAPG